MKKITEYAKAAAFLVAFVCFCLGTAALAEAIHAAKGIISDFEQFAAEITYLALLVYFILRSFWSLYESDKQKRHPSLKIPLESGGELDKYFRSRGIDTDAGRADFVERAATAAAFEENKKGWD